MTAVSMHRGLGLRYACDRSRLSPRLRDRFLELSLDPSTRAWIDDAHARPTSGMRLAARRAAKAMLGDYDANALFDTHDMRVLGREQWSALLGDVSAARWLDVGAGDGKVAAEIRAIAGEVVTTETSTRMAARLRERGFECHAVDLVTEVFPDDRRFAVVSALNVLDRTPRPYSLVERMLDRLEPGGRLVLAVPLPLSPHVHVGNSTVDPDELLPIERRSFEEAASTLVDVALVPLGLELVSMSRVPYLSRGDRTVPVHVLDDCILVLRRVGDAEAPRRLTGSGSPSPS